MSQLGKVNTMSSDKCRCGRDASNDKPHPCHGNGYSCPNSGAKQHFYNARPTCLSGMQMKLAADETWACDKCWESFSKLLAHEASKTNPT